jgi:hypothetical protein
MAKAQLNPAKLDTPRGDAPEALVVAALTRLNRRTRTQPTRVPEWDALRNDPYRKHYVSFIEQASQLIAPTNADLRGQVALALLEIYYLRENGDLVNELQRTWGALPDDVLQPASSQPQPPTPT